MRPRDYKHYYRVYLRALRWRSARYPGGRLQLAGYAHELAHLAARSPDIAMWQRAYYQLVLAA